MLKDQRNTDPPLLLQI